MAFLVSLVVLAVLAAARDSWMRIQLRSPIIPPDLDLVSEGVNLDTASSTSTSTNTETVARFALALLFVICVAAVSRTGSRVVVRTNVLPGDSPFGGVLSWALGLAGALVGAILVTQALAPPFSELNPPGASFVGSGGVYWYLSGAALVVSLALLAAKSTPVRESLSESSAKGWVFTSMAAFLSVALVMIIANPMLAASQLAAAIISAGITSMLVAYSVPMWACMVTGATSFAVLYYQQF